MKVTVEFHTNNPEDMAKLMSVLGASYATPQEEYQPEIDRSISAYTGGTESHPVGDTERTVATQPTAAQLIAGMTLKPTETSTLGDGSKASPGSYVLFNGEDWHVEATYRGTIVAINEAGRADVIKTADCKASVRNAAPTSPRPGTPAALLPNEQTQQQAQQPQNQPNDPITDVEAARLREIATTKVTEGKVAVEAVFEKLASFGVKTIDELSINNAHLMGEWLNLVGEQPQASDGKFGF